MYSWGGSNFGLGLHKVLFFIRIFKSVIIYAITPENTFLSVFNESFDSVLLNDSFSNSCSKYAAWLLRQCKQSCSIVN